MNNNTFDNSLFISTFKRHIGISVITFISTVSAAVLYLSIAPSQYQTSAKLIVGEQDVSVSNIGQQLTDKNTKTPGKSADPVATQAELVKSSQVLDRALKDFKQKTEISEEELPSLRTLRKAIDVEIVPATNILRLVYQYSDPELAAQMLNSVAQSVVQENIETNRAQASALREFLEVQIEQQRRRLEQAEREESEYRQAKGLVNFEAQTTNSLDSLTKLENEERNLLTKLQEISTKINLLKQSTGLDNLDSAERTLRVSKDEKLQQVQSQLKELETKISNRRAYLTDKAPELQVLLEERDTLRAMYQQELSTGLDNTALSGNDLVSNPYSQDLISKYVSNQIEYRALEDKLQTVRRELNNLKSRVAQIPTYQQPLARLIRQRETAESSLKSLQSKLEEAKIAETQSTSSIRVVSSAEINTIPASPRPAAVLVIGATAGIFLSIGTVFLLGIIDDNLHNASEVEQTLNLPILSVLSNIAPIASDTPDLNQFLDNPILVEPYRALLKTLESSSSGQTPTFVISSTVSGEGKSSVALHLSAVAAMLSRRTLIIDADLRQPMQSQILDLPSSPGLAEVLENPRDLLSAVQHTTIKNLSVLTHGGFQSRPAALIESKSMKFLLKTAAEYYDLVIVDSSPANVAADATTLSQLTDGLILVVRPNFVSKEMILDVISKVKKSDASILGVVINEIEQNKTLYLNGKSELSKTHYLSS